MPRMKLEDVARRAGVSVATVSRVVNDLGPVRPATRTRVLRVITKLKYHPNFYARALARGSNRTLGMIVSNLENPFFLDIFRSLEAEARRSGYEVFVANTDYVPRRLTASLRGMMERRVAGLAVIVSEMDPSILEDLSETDLPIFFYDVGVAGPNVSKVKVNYAKGMQKVVEYLYSLGHRRMGFVGHHTGLQPLMDRKETFLGLMRHYSSEVEYTLRAAQDGPQGGYQAAHDILSSGFHPTAVLSVNDFMALGIVRAIRDHGLAVPGDVSVTGFDNIHLSEFASPPLTTVDIPRERIGRMAFQALVPDGPDSALHPTVQGSAARGREIVIEPELIIRGSTAPPKIRA